MKARVTVTLKSGILDPQGKAIEGALRSLGIRGVASVRQGKVFDIEIEGADRAGAEAALKNAFDVSNRGVGYQLNLLADANLVRSMGSDWRLTWDGHEFLRSAVPNAVEDT